MLQLLQEASVLQLLQQTNGALPEPTLATVILIRPKKCVVCLHRIWAKKSLERGAGWSCFKRFLKGSKGVQLRLEDYLGQIDYSDYSRSKHSSLKEHSASM